MKTLNFKKIKQNVSNLFKSNKQAKSKNTIVETPQIDNERFKSKYRGQNFTHKLISKKGRVIFKNFNKNPLHGFKMKIGRELFEAFEIKN